VRPAVQGALAAWQAVTPRTWAFLHGDPAPEAFVVGPDGTCGLLDWASGEVGPCLYDLASAAMYVGPGATDRLVEAYLAHAPVAADEVAEGLAGALRLRWAVQAWYFARRTSEHDLTGLDDASGNRKGLDDARRALGG
jgi:homoserine kinase type II